MEEIFRALTTSYGDSADSATLSEPGVELCLDKASKLI